MGHKEDAVAELQPPVRIWVVEVLHENGMTPTESGGTLTEPPKDEAPKGPTPAEALLQKVSAPRPQDLSVPEGANGEEANAIGMLYGQLLGNLGSHDGGEDLSAANNLIAQIRKAVEDVPLRIAREVEEKRKELLLALSGCKAPEGLPLDENAKIEQRITSYKSMAEKAGPGPLKSLLDEGMPVLRDLILKAGENVSRRTKAAEALRDRIGKATPSDQALPGEIAPLRERGEKLLERLAPPLTDGGLDGATTDTGLLEQDVRKLGETVAERGNKAEILRQRLLKIAPDPGLPGDEAQAFRQKVTLAEQALKTPYSPEMLDTAEKAAVELELEAGQQALVVTERAKRAEGLKLRLGKLAAPPRVMPEEAESLRLAVEQATLLLVSPHAVLTLDNVEKTAGELEGSIVTLAETVVKRDERGKAVSLRMTMLVDPPGLNDTEKEDLKKAREAASLLLTDPPTETGLGQAETKATEAESLGKTVEKAITERATKRKELNEALDKLDIPPEATPADFRLRAQAQAKLRKEITDANTTDTLKKAEEGVEAEKKIVAAMLDLLAERKLAEADIDKARDMLAAEAQTADQGFLSSLRTAVFAAEKSLPGLPDKAAVTKLRTGISDITKKLPESKAYAEEFRAFLVNATLQAKAPGAVDVPKIEGAIQTIRLAAQALAIKMEYAKARLELAKFETTAGVAVGSMAKSDDWQKAIKLFDATHGAKLKTIGRAAMPAVVPAFMAQIKTDRAVPAPGDDITVRTNTLNAHAAKIAEVAAVAELWLKFKPLWTKINPAVTDVDKAYAAATLKLAAGQYTAALAEFAGVNAGTDAAKAVAKTRLATLTDRLDKITNATAAAGVSQAETLLNPVDGKITANDIAGANTEMTKAEKIIDELPGWIEPANRVKALAKAHDSTNAYGFTTEADTKATQFKFAEAAVLLNTAATHLQNLGDYKLQKSQAQGLLATLTTGTPPHTKCAKALTDAESAVTTNKDPLKGTAVLEVLFADKDLKTMAAAIGLWVGRHPDVAAATTKVAGMIPDPLPKAALTDSLKAAETQATAHKYTEALDLLDTHEALLAPAKAFAHARARGVAVFAALERAAKEFPGDVAKIFGAPNKDALQKEIDACNLLAAKTDYAAATKAYEKFLKTCEPMVRETAKLCEAKDGTGSNAGHSLGRHGPDVSDEALLRRLQTGIAADGAPSPCVASSKFENMEAWLAGREMAIQQAVKKGMDLSKTSYDLTGPTAPTLEYSEVVDHGGPIDKAAAGIKPNTAVNNAGALEEADTFETFEELKGITKSTTKMVFVIDSPDADPDRPKTLDQYKARYKLHLQRAAHALLPNPKPAMKTIVVAEPTTVPGHWVMMQHFPLVKGWDQEKGDYIE